MGLNDVVEDEDTGVTGGLGISLEDLGAALYRVVVSGFTEEDSSGSGTSSAKGGLFLILASIL